MSNGSSGYSYTELKQLVEYMEMLEKENERLRKENEELNEENEDLNKENEQLNRENGMLSRGDAVVYKCRGLYKVEVAGAVEDEPRVSLGSESAKMPLNGDFSDKGVEYVIEQLKEQIEALQKLEEGMQDDLQKARKFLSEQPEVQPKHKTPKRRTGPKI